MRGAFIFGVLLALVGLASWALYPREQRRLDEQLKNYRFRQSDERTPG